MKFVISILELFALLYVLLLGLTMLSGVTQSRIFAGLLIVAICLISFALGRTSHGNIAIMAIAPTVSCLIFMAELYHAELGFSLSQDFITFLSFSVGFISFTSFLYGDIKPTLLPVNADGAKEKHQTKKKPNDDSN